MVEAVSRHDDPDVPRDAAALLGRARRAGSLAELTQLFAAAIAPDGFRGHFCIALSNDDDDAEPLFGDAAEIPAALMHGAAIGAIRHLGGGQLLLRLSDWHERRLLLILEGRGLVSANLRARLQGLAEIYACFGVALLERESDAATGAGLGVAQRRCLALLLAGRREPEIADLLGLTPLAVRGHIDAAVTLLGARDRTEAVALAARRGWLASVTPLAGCSESLRDKMVN